MGKSKANKSPATAEAKPEEVAKPVPEPKPSLKALPKKSPVASPKKGPEPDPKEAAPKKEAKKKAKGAAAEPATKEPVAQAGPKEAEAFFNKCISMMQSSVCRDKLKDPAIGRPGVALIDMQKSQWDTLGIDREAGRAAVDNVKSEDKELYELRIKLVETAKSTYLQAIKDRKPGAPTSKGDLPRETLLEMFDVFNLRLDHADIVARIKECATKTGDLAQSVIRELQNESFELLGVVADHGHDRLHGQLDSFAKDPEFLFAMDRWQRRCDQACVEQLRVVMTEGVTLKCDEAIKIKLFEMVATEGLDALEDDDKKALLEKNAKKVNILRALPAESRQLHLAKLADVDKIELIKAELLLVKIMQHQQKQQQIVGMARTNGPWKAGSEFRTLELVKTVDRKQAAIAKGTWGTVLEVDKDGDLRVSIPSKSSKEHTFYFIARADFGKLKICGENTLRRFEGNVQHQQFGSKALPVFITLTSPKTGVWAIVGQSADIQVDLSGDRMVITQEETILEGAREANGMYEGRCIQEGDPNGHFYIREIRYLAPPPPKPAAKVAVKDAAAAAAAAIEEAEKSPEEKAIEKAIEEEEKKIEKAKKAAAAEEKKAEEAKKSPAASPKKGPEPDPKQAAPKKEAKKKGKK